RLRPAAAGGGRRDGRRGLAVPWLLPAPPADPRPPVLRRRPAAWPAGHDPRPGRAGAARGARLAGEPRCPGAGAGAGAGSGGAAALRARPLRPRDGTAVRRGAVLLRRPRRGLPDARDLPDREGVALPAGPHL